MNKNKILKLQEFIKFYRKSKKLTQKQFGEIFDVSQDTVSLWELGKLKPNYENLRKMCILFEIDGNYILEIATNKQRKEIQMNSNKR